MVAGPDNKKRKKLTSDTLRTPFTWSPDTSRYDPPTSTVLSSGQKPSRAFCAICAVNAGSEWHIHTSSISAQCSDGRSLNWMSSGKVASSRSQLLQHRLCGCRLRRLGADSACVIAELYASVGVGPGSAAMRASMWLLVTDSGIFCPTGTGDGSPIASLKSLSDSDRSVASDALSTSSSNPTSLAPYTIHSVVHRFSWCSQMYPIAAAFGLPDDMVRSSRPGRDAMRRSALSFFSLRLKPKPPNDGDAGGDGGAGAVTGVTVIDGEEISWFRRRDVDCESRIRSTKSVLPVCSRGGERGAKEATRGARGVRGTFTSWFWKRVELVALNNVSNRSSSSPQIGAGRLRGAIDCTDLRLSREDGSEREVRRCANGGTGDDWHDEDEMTWSIETWGLCRFLRCCVLRRSGRSADADADADADAAAVVETRETDDAAGELVVVEFVRTFASSISPRRNASRYVISQCHCFVFRFPCHSIHHSVLHSPLAARSPARCCRSGSPTGPSRAARSSAAARP